MQCYTEILPPTGVSHALTLPFTSPSSNNLVIAKTTVLQVFDVVSVATKNKDNAPQSDEAPSAHQLQQQQQQTKLVLVSEHVLPGVVADLARVRLTQTKSGGDALLVSARDAKLSLVEWDPVEHKISTISIHYYEQDEVHLNPWVPDISRCPTSLTVDPSSRCAVFNFCGNKIAILPFKQSEDDLAMDDFDAELGGGESNKEAKMDVKKDEGEDKAVIQPLYSPSFVLPLPALDPSFLHISCLEFLHEYREPTFGILYSQVAPSNNLFSERKDVLSYSIVTLDLDQRASTTLVTVPRLPSDLFKIVPLPLPVGGALLVGSNEIVHVDQAGKTNAVGVNDFARVASSFSMADQSDLGLRLEDSVVEHLATKDGDILILLSDGRMLLLIFSLDGRSVSGMSLRFVSEAAGGNLFKGSPACATIVGNSKLFLASEDTDCLLVEYSRPQIKAKKAKTDHEGQDDASNSDEDEDDDMYEDDLYSASPKEGVQANGEEDAERTLSDPYVFRELDRLTVLGPVSDITLGRPTERKTDKDDKSNITSELELVATQGKEIGGSLTVLRQKLDPHVLETMKIQGVKGVWFIEAKDLKSRKRSGVSEAAANETIQYVILATESEDGENSLVRKVTDKKLEETTTPDFNPDNDTTIDIGTLCEGGRIVQVLKGEVRSYDKTLGLSQIYPVWDEDTSEEKHVVSVTFADPYVAAIRDDGSLLLLQADESGDLDEVPVEGVIESNNWLWASLYADHEHFLSATSQDHKDQVLLFLLDTEGKLYTFNLPHTRTPACQVDGLDILPISLPLTSPVRRTFPRAELKDFIVANLGDQIHQAPHLLLRTAQGELTIYELFHTPTTSSSPDSSSNSNTIRLQKISSQSVYDVFGNASALSLVPEYPPMRALEDITGYRCVFIPGAAPRFVVKTATSAPHVVALRGSYVRSLCALHTQRCEKGFAYVDGDDHVRICQIPKEVSLEYSWTTRRIPFKEEAVGLVYHQTQDVYALGTTQAVGFKLPDDNEIHPEWQYEDLAFFPQVETGSVQLLEPKTWSIIDSQLLDDPAERIMCVKCLNMEVSEITNERRDMIVVGTAITKGEDVPARGSIYVYDVINVVPDPKRPELSRKLKLFAKENVRGAVTSISGIGGQGFLINAQGQKCMVRGLKEDGSLLPVAFMDMQCYTSVLKELKGTGLCLMADALKGLWFAGYSEEPYKLSLFSKDNENTHVLCADFLPDGKKLYIIASDHNCNLHVFQYDPEDPSSANGDRLLHRSSFQTGHFTTTITLLPRVTGPPPPSSLQTDANEDAMDVDTYSHAKSPPYQVFVTSSTGQMAVVTPLTEESYRRLTAVQSQLTTALEQPCGLNPRAFRAVCSDAAGGRGMVDGSLLRRYLDLSPLRRAEIATRAGADPAELQADLELVGGTGMAYL